jgi:hypothetical protein
MDDGVGVDIASTESFADGDLFDGHIAVHLFQQTGTYVRCRVCALATRSQNCLTYAIASTVVNKLPIPQTKPRVIAATHTMILLTQD